MCLRVDLKRSFNQKAKASLQEKEDTDRKTQLALACIAAIKPDMKSEEVAHKINKAYLLENPDCYADLNVDED